jgi:hypothetical protein
MSKENWDDFVSAAKECIDKKALKSWDSIRLVDVDNWMGYYGWLWDNKSLKNVWKASYSKDRKNNIIQGCIPKCHLK